MQSCFQKRISTPGGDRILLFNGSFTVWSNFFRSTFELEGRQFNCVEQYYQFKKALHFHDTETAFQILATKQPWRQKWLGRKVRGFDKKRWSYANIQETSQFLWIKRGNELESFKELKVGK